MSVLYKRFHEGNIYENLADFFLSSIGISNPPRRQFDHGYDFYCYISETLPDNEELLRFDYPFNIQIKSGKGKSIIYGKGYNKWRAEDIAWLFKHQTPFLLGFVDTEKYELKIYDTTGIWYLYVFQKTQCSQIEFRVRTKASAHENHEMRKIPEPETIKKWGPGKGGGIKYVIELDHPITTITIDDTKKPLNLAVVKRALKEVVAIERRNIANREIGINFFKEIKRNIPNHPVFLIGSAFETYDPKYTAQLLNSLKEALISLQINAHHHNEIQLKDAIISLLKLLPSSWYYEQLYRSNPEVFCWIKDLIQK